MRLPRGAVCGIFRGYDVFLILCPMVSRPMMALGIDLGGTKISAQLFDADWAVVDSLRIPTPDGYPALLAGLCSVAGWADQIAGCSVTIGLGAAGAVHPKSGRVLAANLAANGQPLPSDLGAALARSVTYLNDSRALALSEACFGAGRAYDAVFGLVLGTGVGGGFVRARRLHGSTTGTAGEVGHIAAPAHLVARHGLPILDCACGRQGCIETLISGAGLGRLAVALTGQDMTAPQIIAARKTDDRMQAVWRVWCALAADLVQTLTLTLDPDCIVLGGGLSDISGLVDDLTAAVADAQFAGFASPVILRASGGADSGARGAAYAAWQAAHD